MPNSVFFLSGLVGGFLAAASPTGLHASQARPATGLAAIRVPEGFTVELAAGPELAPYGMFGALDEHGRLFIAESSGKNIRGAAMAENPECRIRLLEDTHGDGIYDRAKIFADKVGIPMGVLWYHGGLYVASPPDFLRFEDTDGDGVADRRTVLLTGWQVKGTASLHGPFVGPDGSLYLTDGRHGFDIRTKEGTNLKGQAARIWRMRPDGSRLHPVAGGGMDNPVEVVFLPTGEMIGTMTYFTNPMHGQRDSLTHWIDGGVYGKWHECVSEFKQTGDLLPPMTKFARIAPAGLEIYRGTSFGPAFRGNLFSAQFNTHRIQRHTLFREGATFRTEDEDFFTSSDPDFHPCDVLEDADGSLLVIDTGAWYVDQCPLSRISKPDIRGGIYRVRKAGTPKIADPRGDQLKLDRRSAGDLAALLEDSRPVVRDRAAELLVSKGEAAVSALLKLREKSKSSEARCLAVWALFRIGSPKAQASVRAALADPDLDVRLAAAKAAGLASDRQAKASLLKLLMEDEPSVQLAAATALGKLGDAGAVPYLLGAAAAPADRFVEHALIYALIELKQPLLLQTALSDSHPNLRKAALIALDQMDGSPLQREQLVPCLADNHPDLRRAALWVASHHPDWSEEVVGFLRGRLLAAALPAEESDAVRDALLTFCGATNVQRMVGDLLGDDAVAVDRRLLLLETIDRCSLTNLPALWIERLGGQLEHPDAQVRARAVALIRTRGVKGLDPTLQKLAASESQPRPIRVAALGALVTRQPKLDDAAFALLLTQLKPETDATARSAAAQVLMKASLSDHQLLRLAEGPLAQADALTLPALLEAFGASTNEAVGQALVGVLTKSTAGLDQLGGGKLEQLIHRFPESVQNAAAPLVARIAAQQAARFKRLDELEPLLNGGDVGRGRRVFFGQKAACASCHAIGAEGGTLGPDLTSIGAIRSGRDILEAIAFPRASFVPGYEPMRIETADDVQNGIIAGETAEAIQLRTAAATELRIPRSAIRAVSPGTVSVMPEGLDLSLGREELLDLLAFLQSQNGEQWLQPQKLGKQDLRRQAAQQQKPPGQ